MALGAKPRLAVAFLDEREHVPSDLRARREDRRLVRPWVGVALPPKPEVEHNAWHDAMWLKDAWSAAQAWVPEEYRSR